ncbi:unnamed protein product [Diatraea saccharalis]|uniref:Uncharacterized protein n=1 Tax=Diatraea saccharalis TaxID=40085 RepID=A0A9N9RBY0_9NEOP|nr:unnamed protein product [Diatraea saccharalis]
MKWKASRSSTPSDLSSSTVLARLVRCISGTVAGSSSRWYCRCVYSVQCTVVYYLRRRVHEVEGEQVLDAERLEQQHGVGEVGALYLGHGGGQQLALVLPLRVQCTVYSGVLPAAAGP